MVKRNKLNVNFLFNIPYILPQFGSNIKCFDMKDTISTLLGLVWQLSDSDLLKNVYEIRHLEKKDATFSNVKRLHVNSCALMWQIC